MQTALAALELVSKLHQIPIDMRAVSREFALPAEEVSPPEFLRILKHQGYLARMKQRSMQQLLSRPHPLPIVLMGRSQSYAVLLRVDMAQQRALVFLPELGKTKDMPLPELQEHFSDRCILLRHKQIYSQVKFGFIWFFKEIMAYRRVMAEVLLGAFIVQLFGLIGPLFTQVILDKVIVNRAMNTLSVMAIAFVAMTVFECLLNVSRNYIFLHTANKIDAKLGAKLFRHLFSLPYRYFESRKVGNITSRIRELDQIRDFITQRSVTLLVDLAFSVVFLVMMGLYSLPLMGVVVGFIAAIGLLYALITPALRARLEQKFQMAAQSNSYLVESITGIQTVKTLAIEGSMQRRWEDYLGNYLNASFQLSTLGNIAGAMSTFLQKGITICVLYVGVGLVLNHQMSVGQLIAFQMFAGQLTSPILRLVSLWNDFQQTLMGVDRLGDILNHPTDLPPNNPITLPKVQGNIRFEDVCFRYQSEGTNVLDHISINIPAGTSVGFVGRSGSGKSTLTRLVQRLYMPQEGSIYLDGVDIRHMNPSWLRQQIGTVIQDSYLFSGSIRENIAMARPDAPIEQVIQAAQLAGAHDFIAQMPEGYDTLVGERGSTLSGGQRQRIAIARALITQPRILIFDEATSALDYESERQIQDSMRDVRKGRTVFIIAHRLSTVRECDIIFVLDKGKLIEAGTHQELLAQRGYYHFLYQQQEPTANAHPV